MLVDLATYFFIPYCLQPKSVKYPTTDPKVMGSNPGGAKIGLHVFHKPHNGHKYWFTQEANTKSSLV
jgi:hypothetical protein